MKTSINYKLAFESNDEEFITYCMYIRPYNIERYEFNTIVKQIENRMTQLGYTFEFGCCGTNVIRRIEQ